MSDHYDAEGGEAGASQPEIWETTSEEATRAVGRRLAPELLPDGVLLLSGEMGTGKTVLTKGVATGLGIEEEQVRSPTFTLVHEHEGSVGSLIHIDLYRLGAADLEAIGLSELLARQAVKVIEWAERLPHPVPGAVRLHLVRGESGHRRIVCSR